MNSKGQADVGIGVGGLIALLILISLGAYVLYEVTGSLDFDDQRVDANVVLTNTTFTTDASVNWDNQSTGATDNTRLQWDNWGTTDNAVWDNTGPQPIIGARTATWTRWYQTLVVPTAYDGVTSASITGSYLLADNTETENISLYVILQRPGGDNVVILSHENTASLFVADNSTFTAIDNTVTSSINAGGTYILWLQDNIDRVALANDGSDNYVGIVWTSASLSVTTYTAGYAENAIGNVEDKGATTLDLVTILAIVLVAALIIGVVMRAIGGAVGGQGAGTVAPAF